MGSWSVFDIKGLIKSVYRELEIFKGLIFCKKIDRWEVKKARKNPLEIKKRPTLKINNFILKKFHLDQSLENKILISNPI